MNLPLVCLLLTVTKDGKQKWEHLLVEVENSNYRKTRKSNKKETVPLLIVACAGVYDQAKLELTNALLIDWQIDLKMEKTPKGEDACPFYQPSSQNVGFCTFLVHMKKTHGWIWVHKDFTK